MEKVKNWCVTQVVLVLDQEYVDEEYTQDALRMLTEGGAAALCTEAGGGMITLATVRNTAFAGTRKALLAQLKRTDDLLRGHEDVIRQICEKYGASAITEVEVDYLYDPSAFGEEPFQYYCFGSDDSFFVTDAWGSWVPWDGLCWDTRYIGERVREDMQPLSADELCRFLEEDGIK